MRIKTLFDDDDAVSPVIGVILMVAITVILAAVIATFVLGLGDQVSNTSPQASFSTDWEGSSGSADALEITHSGGDTIKASDLYVRGDYGDGAGNMDIAWTDGAYGSSSDISAGNSLTIGTETGEFGSSNVAADGEADIIWEPASGDNSATLGSWEGPDA